MVFKTKYKFKDGWNPKNVSAQTVGEECERLANTDEGLTSQTLLDASRDENAPLHNAFEWDDEIAAERYRLRQASDIIKCVVAVPEKNEPPVKAFCHVSVAEKPQYKHIKTVVKDEDLTAQLLDEALQYLRTFKTRYFALKDYVSIAGVIKAIDTAEQLEKESKL